MTFGILILVVGLYCGISQAKDKPVVRCEASAVYLGGEGQVTCHYPMDLSHIDCIVSIEQFVDDSEKTVLDCVWDGISQCDNVRQGYRVTNVTGNTLTVTIPKVTDEHRGRYGCSMADRMTSYGYDLCTFEVKDRTMVHCEASAVHIGGEGQVTCYYPMDLSLNEYAVRIEQFVHKSEITVLDCVWNRISQCDNVRQGYRVTNLTGNTLTVTIPKVTDEHRGRYGCTLVDSKTSYGYVFCTFKLKGTTPHSSQPESSTEKAATDQSDADKGMSGGTIAILVIGVIVITVFVLAVIFGTYRRCRRQERNNTATAKLDNRADSQEKEVCRVNLDDHLEDTDAVTGGKGTNNRITNSTFDTSDSGFFDPRTESEHPVVIKEEGGQIWFKCLENKEMAENAERQDAASDAEDTTDNTAPLLSDQEPRYDQDAEVEEEEQEGLLASSGDQANLDKIM